MSTVYAETATIHTATVEIKTLTVSGKQMTLAVFRQLDIDPVVMAERQVEFMGTIWGRVNYHVDCRSEGEHVHVIWENEDNELRRDCITYNPLEYEDVYLESPETRGQWSAMYAIVESMQQLFIAV